ncbi:MAG: hypothetical protein M5U25_11590 [Planctomycetota bacterium]|nr:hypothetical protein [Planctomycetota bacterium]
MRKNSRSVRDISQSPEIVCDAVRSYFLDTFAALPTEQIEADKRIQFTSRGWLRPRLLVTVEPSIQETAEPQADQLSARITYQAIDPSWARWVIHATRLLCAAFFLWGVYAVSLAAPLLFSAAAVKRTGEVLLHLGTFAALPLCLLCAGVGALLLLRYAKLDAVRSFWDSIERCATVGGQWNASTASPSVMVEGSSTGGDALGDWGLVGRGVLALVGFFALWTIRAPTEALVLYGILALVLLSSKFLGRTTRIQRQAALALRSRFVFAEASATAVISFLMMLAILQIALAFVASALNVNYAGPWPDKQLSPVLHMLNMPRTDTQAYVATALPTLHEDPEYFGVSEPFDEESIATQLPHVFNLAGFPEVGEAIRTIYLIAFAMLTALMWYSVTPTLLAMRRAHREYGKFADALQPGKSARDFEARISLTHAQQRGLWCWAVVSWAAMLVIQSTVAVFTFGWVSAGVGMHWDAFALIRMMRLMLIEGANGHGIPIGVAQLLWFLPILPVIACTTFLPLSCVARRLQMIRRLNQQQKPIPFSSCKKLDGAQVRVVQGQPETVSTWINGHPAILVCAKVWRHDVAFSAMGPEDQAYAKWALSHELYHLLTWPAKVPAEALSALSFSGPGYFVPFMNYDEEESLADKFGMQTLTSSAERQNALNKFVKLNSLKMPRPRRTPLMKVLVHAKEAMRRWFSFHTSDLLGYYHPLYEHRVEKLRELAGRVHFSKELPQGYRPLWLRNRMWRRYAFIGLAVSMLSLVLGYFLIAGGRSGGVRAPEPLHGRCSWVAWSREHWPWERSHPLQINQVHCVAADSNWIYVGTTGGLLRCELLLSDGASWEVLVDGAGSSLCRDAMVTLAFDDHLLVGDQRGVATIQGSSWERIRWLPSTTEYRGAMTDVHQLIPTDHGVIVNVNNAIGFISGTRRQWSHFVMPPDKPHVWRDGEQLVYWANEHTWVLDPADFKTERNRNMLIPPDSGSVDSMARRWKIANASDNVSLVAPMPITANQVTLNVGRRWTIVAAATDTAGTEGGVLLRWEDTTSDSKDAGYELHRVTQEGNTQLPVPADIGEQCISMAVASTPQIVVVATIDAVWVFTMSGEPTRLSLR